MAEILFVLGIISSNIVLITSLVAVVLGEKFTRKFATALIIVASISFGIIFLAGLFSSLTLGWSIGYVKCSCLCGHIY